MRAPVLRVMLFGWPQVHLVQDGQVRPLALPGNKPQALLYYLLLAAGPVARETLMTLLWSEADANRARTSLRNALYQLQKSLPPHALQVDRHQVSLSSRYQWDLDIDRWRQLLQPPLSLEQVQQAVTLYRGDFLEGFHVANAPEFDHWHTTMIQHFRSRMLQAVDQGLRLALPQGKWSQAETLLTFALSREPWREDYHRALLQVLTWQGKYAAALKQYQRCCQVLQQELGAEPSHELQTLVEEIHRRRQQPPPFQVPDLPLPLVSREQEQAELCQALAEHRLVTLVGPNGVGKTMLALALAHHYRHRMAHGVYFLALDTLPDPALWIPLLAERLGLSTEPAANLPRRIGAYLQTREILLVLDDWNAGAPQIAQLAQWLQQAPRLRVVVTASQPIGLRHERVYAVRPLAYPPAHEHPPPHTYPAGRLFLALWQRFVPTPLPGPEPHVWIARLCRLLEGHPLALELAVMHGRERPLPHLVQALEQDLDVLQTSWPAIPARHRSLRTLFQHLWNTLKPDERDLLARLSIFAGPFTRAEAWAVAQVTPSQLQRLLVRGWLQPAFHLEEGLVLHRVLRTYGREHLSPERHPLRERHAQYYLRWLAQRPARLRAADVQAIHARYANVLAAWEWAVRQRHWAWLAQALPAWHAYHELHGLFGEGARLFQQALAHLGEETHPVVGHLYARAAALHFRHGALLTARTLAQQAIDRLHAEPEARLFARNVLGIVLLHMGEFEASGRELHAVVEEARQQGLVTELIKGLINLSSLYLRTGRYADLAPLLTQGLEWCQTHDDAEGVAFFHLHLGTLALLQGHWEVAEQHLQHTLATAQALNRPYFAMHAWLNLAMAHALQNAPPASIAQAARRAAHLARDMGDPVTEARAQGWLAWAQHRQQNHQQAWNTLAQALGLLPEDAEPSRLHLMVLAAHMWAAQGEVRRAAALAAYARAHPAAEAPARERAQALLNTLAVPAPAVGPEPPPMLPPDQAPLVQA